MKRANICFWLFLLFMSCCPAQAEEITLTTYYPAPYGNYKELRANQLSVGSGYRGQNLSDGTFIVEGNLGIATPSPQKNLHVNGSVRINGFSSCTALETNSSGDLACGQDDDSEVARDCSGGQFLAANGSCKDATQIVADGWVDQGTESCDWSGQIKISEYCQGDDKVEVYATCTSSKIVDFTKNFISNGCFVGI